MSFINIGMNRSRTVLSFLVMILVAGAVSFRDIPKESNPDISIPVMYVSVNLEGISPEDAENLLVKPLEQELNGIEGAKQITGSAYQGGGNVVVEFEAGFDSEKALDDIKTRVDRAKPELPSTADDPIVSEVNFSLFPVLLVILSGPVDERHLLGRADDLKKRIEALPEILEANITGDREEIVEIIIDPSKLESYALTPDEVLIALNRSNLLVAAGNIENGFGRFGVKVPGLIEDLRQIEELPLRQDAGNVLKLADVADVQRVFKDNTVYARQDGTPSLSLEIVKRSGENVIDTVEKVRALVIEESKNWNDGVNISFSQDVSFEIKRMLSDLNNNVFAAILLVMIVVIAVLGIRSGLLVGISIPSSFLAAVLILYAGGLTVNVVVLFGLIMSVGLLVDGTIVVVEYANRQLDAGVEKRQAYSLAAQRMAWPIIASTATTLAAFMPLLFWPGLVGEFMKFLPLTLIITLSASLFMALFFIPILGANFETAMKLSLTLAGFLAGFWLAAMVARAIGLGPVAVLAGLGGGYLGARYCYKNIVPRFISVIATPGGDKKKANMLVDFKALGPFTRKYLDVLEFLLERPKKIILASVGVLIFSWVAYGVFGRGVEFFPSIEPETAVLLVHARGNLAVDERDNLVRQVENAVLELAKEKGEIETVFSSAGFIDVRSEVAQDIIGKIFLDFADWDKRRKADVILAELRERTSGFGGIYVEARASKDGPASGKPIVLELSASDPSIISDSARRLRAYLETVEGLQDIEDTLPIPGIEWRIEIDRVEAAKFDIDISILGNFVRLITNGVKLSTYRPIDTDEEIDILLRLPKKNRHLGELDRFRVSSDEGSVPASNFVSRTPSQPSGTLTRVDRRRIVSLKSDVKPGVLVDEKLTEIRENITALGLSPELRIDFKGEDEEQRDAQAFLSRAFGLALFAMGLILLTQFNSFYQVLLILSAVIMSTTGVMLGLLITGQPFGIIMCGIGVIALAGIVVNNNIVLIDTFNHIYRESGDIRFSIFQAGVQRLRPVLLTSATTILGLMPMVLAVNIDFIRRDITVGGPSTEWWQQLATAVTFGLGFATLLTLLMTPVSLLLVGEQFKKQESKKSLKKLAKKNTPLGKAV